MPRYGFNGEKNQMKVFILFVMRHVLDRVTLDQMGEMVLIDDNMNYFLYSECVAELVEAELLLKEPRKTYGDDYTLTPHGYKTLMPLERSLPNALRRAAEELIPVVLARLRRDARLHTAIYTRGGDTLTRLTMTDGVDPILHIELVAGTRERAGAICGNFRQNAEAIFDGLLKLLLAPPKKDPAPPDEQ